MEKKQRFFIYDRKEVGVLLLLGVMVAVFAFTLGVHLGKRVGLKTEAIQTSANTSDKISVSPVAAVSPSADAEQVMSEPPGDNPSAATTAASADAATTQALHDEVKKTGIKLDQARQLELPEKTKSANAGALTPGQGQVPETAPTQGIASPTETITSDHTQDDTTTAPAADVQKPAAHHEISHRGAYATHGKFTLQIGSYATDDLARSRLKDLQISGLSPRIQPTDIRGKGRWYRLYLGRFPTRKAAIAAGKKYRAEGVIASFIVSKSVE